MVRKMQVLVTGGTGRIGGNLAKALIDRGYDVRVLALPGDKASEKVKNMGAEVVEGDLRSLDDCVAAVKGIDAIYHFCLLYTSPSPRDLSTARMPSSA